MTFVRNVLRDLVEKRLWPIAVALVAALVAVPVVLSGGAPAPAPAPAGGATASASDPGAAITVADQPVVQQRSRPGRLRDPFVQPKSAKPATPSTATAAPAATPASTAALGIPTGGSSPIGTSSPVTAPSFTPTPTGTIGGGTTPTPKAPQHEVFSVDLRFGHTDAMRPISDVARLTPLPSIDFPFFVFLGVLEDRKTATFLISSDVVPTGDGVCRPSKDQCDTLELKAGDTEFLDRTRPDGSVVQYQVELVRIHQAGATGTEALAAYARKSIAGQELVRTIAVSEGSAALRAYHYRPAEGLLVRAKAQSHGTARAASATPRYVFRPGEVPVFRAFPKRRG